MKTTPILLLLAVAISACSTSPTVSQGRYKDGSPIYPARGFVVDQTSTMFYWRPWVVNRVWGPAPAPKDSMAKGWVTTDDDGHVFVSPELASKLRK